VGAGTDIDLGSAGNTAQQRDQSENHKDPDTGILHGITIPRFPKDPVFRGLPLRLDDRILRVSICSPRQEGDPVHAAPARAGP
jgi:hypothetical protein